MSKNKIERQKPVSDRRVRFHPKGKVPVYPEILELEYNEELDLGDLAIFPDTPENRCNIVYGAKARYNRSTREFFADRFFVHWYEVRRDEAVIVIQRVGEL